MYWRPLAIGLSSFVPGGERLLARKGTGGTSSARYCYEVWLKHLVLLQAHGMRALPRSVAELASVSRRSGIPQDDEGSSGAA